MREFAESKGLQVWEVPELEGYTRKETGMIRHFTMAFKFMKGYPFKVRFIFACFFMFQEKYRTMPLPELPKLPEVVEIEGV